MLRARVAAAAAGCLAGLTALAAPPPAAGTVGARPVSARLAAFPAGAGFGAAAPGQLVRELRGAWRITRGRGVIVAIVGQGVDPAAAGFGGRVTSGPSFGNVSRDSPAPGTVVASAIAGSGPSAQNPSGTIGLAPQARILSLRVPGAAAEDEWEADDAEAIRYAARHGARVIFVDLIGNEDELLLDSAVQFAETRHAVVISDEFPYGKPRNAAEYPASLPGVLGAGTTILPGWPVPPRRFASPANDSILVAAPGNVLTVSGPGGVPYQVYNQLSAAAWLTATVTLIKSAYPDLPPGLVARAIAVSARDHPRAGYSTRTGFGLLNPLGALRESAALARLPRAALPGPQVAAPGARLGAGPVPGVIHAVHHSTRKLAALTGVMAAGLILLCSAFLLYLRWRRRPPAAGPAGQDAPA
jgi:Subtilase family